MVIMDELIFIGYSLVWLVTIFGLYLAASSILRQYYDYKYSMKNLPKTYLIRYVIVPKTAVTEDYDPDETETDADESDSYQEDQDDPLSLVAGCDLLRVTFITCPPSEIIKKMKQAIVFNNEEEVFQLIGFEELC